MGGKHLAEQHLAYTVACDWIVVEHGLEVMSVVELQDLPDGNEWSKTSKCVSQAFEMLAGGKQIVSKQV